MSETFYIKKTAFDDNNFDLTQRETDSFIIGPGELNGPAGLARDSDLELYGFGSLKWGEGVDQNQYRLMESFACPPKVTGDFLVDTDVADSTGDGKIDFVPGSGSFDTGVHPITPKDERDLGIGNGITEPLVGQRWYNTNTILAGGETLYTFTTAGTWLSSHILVDDLSLSGNTIINLGDPDFPADRLPVDVSTEDKQDALTVGWSDLRYVNETGDSMEGTLEITPLSGPALTLNGAMGLTGNLTMIGNMGLTGTMTVATAATVALDITGVTNIIGNTNITGDLSLTDGDTINLGNVDDLSLTHDGTNSFIQNTTGELTIDNAGARINLLAPAAGSYIMLKNGGLFAAKFGGTNKDVKLYYGGNQRFATVTDGVVVTGDVSITSLTPGEDHYATRKDYVNDNFVNVGGDNMNLGASLNFSGGGEVRGLPLVPGSLTDAASKNYVDTKFNTTRNAVYSTAGTHTFTVPTGVTSILVSGTGAGQGGQGGGDGPTGTPTIPARPDDSYVSGSLGIIRFKGGYSEFGVLDDSTHVTYDNRNLLNLSVMVPGLQPTDCIEGDNCQGGVGGHTAWGNGGTAGNPAGGDGARGGGGGGGFAQDFNEGQNFGWGGAGGGFSLAIALPVTAGSNLSVRITDGTSGSSGVSGRNGGDGGTAYITLNW